MKKTIVVIMAVLMTASMLLAGCGENVETTVEDTAEETTVATKATETTAAEKHSGEFLDVEKLDEIEGRDKCPVKVSKIEFEKNANSGYLTIGQGKDSCNITITNNSGSEISEVTIYVLAYTEGNELVKFNTGGLATAFGNGGDKYIKAFDTKDSTIANGASDTFGIDCNLSDGNVTGVRVIVASYKIGDQEYENDIAEDWVKYYQAGKTTVVK